MSLEQEENALISRYNQLVSNASVHHYDELFAHPLHPYTRSLLSAIPLPNPEAERKKKLLVYDPSVHHYETDKPTFREIEPGHFIMANEEEMAAYRQRL